MAAAEHHTEDAAADAGCSAMEHIAESPIEDAGLGTPEATTWACRDWKRTSTKKSRLCATCDQDLLKQTLYRCDACGCELCNSCARVRGGLCTRKVRCGPPCSAELLRQATWAAAREALPPARTATRDAEDDNSDGEATDTAQEGGAAAGNSGQQFQRPPETGAPPPEERTALQQRALDLADAAASAAGNDLLR